MTCNVFFIQRYVANISEKFMWTNLFQITSYSTDKYRLRLNCNREVTFTNSDFIHDVLSQVSFFKPQRIEGRFLFNTQTESTVFNTSPRLKTIIQLSHVCLQHSNYEHGGAYVSLPVLESHLLSCGPDGLDSCTSARMSRVLGVGGIVQRE